MAALAWAAVAPPVVEIRDVFIHAEPLPPGTLVAIAKLLGYAELVLYKPFVLCLVEFRFFPSDMLAQKLVPVLVPVIF